MAATPQSTTLSSCWDPTSHSKLWQKACQDPPRSPKPGSGAGLFTNVQGPAAIQHLLGPKNPCRTGLGVSRPGTAVQKRPSCECLREPPAGGQTVLSRAHTAILRFYPRNIHCNFDIPLNARNRAHTKPTSAQQPANHSHQGQFRATASRHQPQRTTNRCDIKNRALITRQLE